MHRILIVDDDMFFRTVLKKILTGHGYEITLAESGIEALETLRNQTFDLMISDINMTPMNGLELLQKAHAAYPDLGIIMLTGNDEVEVAFDAMKKGAFDFLVKPFQLNELFLTVKRSLECYSASPDNPPIQSRLDRLEGLVTESASMKKVGNMIRRMAPADVIVLLCGERGTDKELIARTLHYYSPRKTGPFTALDSTTLTAAELIEKLLGHVTHKASTQANSTQDGMGGTFFIDHIETMPLDTQTTLLEVIQNNEIHNEGDSTPLHVDARLIVASSENLETLVKQKTFHENLYYRLSALRIDIPALRNRTEDIPLIMDQILRRDVEAGADIPVIDSQAKEILCNYAWPGNTSELETVLRQALSLLEKGRITKASLPEKLITAFEEGVRSRSIVNPRDQLKGQSFKAFLHEKQKKITAQNQTNV